MDHKTEPVKIIALDVERFKRLTALTVEPAKDGLTILGGKNRQGKTSGLDSICFVLGGKRFKPSEPQNRDSEEPLYLRAVLSNGIIAERKGKNSALTVTAPDGLTGNQTLLDGFLEPLALNLPKFMASNATEKADTLLKIIGAGDELEKLDTAIAGVFEERRVAGQIAEQAEAEAKALERFDDAPEELVSVSALVAEIEGAQEAAQTLEKLKGTKQGYLDSITQEEKHIKRWREEIEESLHTLEQERQNLKTTQTVIDTVVVPDIEPLREKLDGAEEVNSQVRANENHAAGHLKAKQKRRQHKALDGVLEGHRTERAALLDGVNMPLPGLSIVDGELVYKGDKWDCMSGSDQHKVAVSIVKEIKPECGFVLMDHLELMDPDSLTEFGQWAQSQGLQIIATRVMTGNESEGLGIPTLIIEDGEVLE